MGLAEVILEEAQLFLFSPLLAMCTLGRCCPCTMNTDFVVVIRQNTEYNFGSVLY